MSASRVSQPTVGELSDLVWNLGLSSRFAATDEEADAFWDASGYIKSLPLGTKIKTFHYKRSAGK